MWCSYFQVIKYVHANTVMDMLTQMENLILNRESTTLDDLDPDDSDDMFFMPTLPTPTPNAPTKTAAATQLFSSPQRRIQKSKIRDTQNTAPRGKKPRRRRRKENGGYDISPTATCVDDSSSVGSDEDVGDIQL